jgi:hypothetical protein
MVHSIASRAGDIHVYSRATGFDVEDFCVNVFDKSAKQKQCLHCFCDTTYADMVKHVSTRWLSLESAVSRAAIKSYFLSNDDSNGKFQASAAVLCGSYD